MGSEVSLLMDGQTEIESSFRMPPPNLSLTDVIYIAVDQKNSLKPLRRWPIVQITRFLVTSDHEPNAPQGLEQNRWSQNSNRTPPLLCNVLKGDIGLWRCWMAGHTRQVTVSSRFIASRNREIFQNGNEKVKSLRLYCRLRSTWTSPFQF